jgi:hypothetical protein
MDSELFRISHIDYETRVSRPLLEVATRSGSKVSDVALDYDEKRITVRF